MSNFSEFGLSVREKVVYDAISKSKAPMSPEDIAEVVFSATERPKAWRHSLLATLRRLSLKSVLLPQLVERTTSRGRGNSALFRTRSNPLYIQEDRR
jgi:hypothetical protein